MTDNRNQPNVAVFLDIDGCVSPLPRQNPYRFDIDEQYNYEMVQPMVPVCDHVADWLTGPHPGATLVWSSSWGTKAMGITRSLGGGPQQTVFDTPLGPVPNKPAAITAWCARNPGVDTVVIVDDDYFETNRVGPRSLRLTPNPYRGLTPVDLEIIDDFIASNAMD